MAEISKINANNTTYDIKDSTARAALAEVIDGGAAGTKNHCTQASGSNNPSSDRWINIPVSDVGVGQWVMSFGTLTSTDTDDTLCQAICFNSSNQQVSNWVNFKREPNTNKTFTITDTVSYVRLYPANSYAASEGDTVTFTDAMLSPKVLYDADPEFEPYAPAKTNVEITPALIEQVDNGAKNRFDPASAWDSKTAYGVTVTRNGDTYSIASGTTQSGGNNFINMGYQANTNLIPAGDWVLSFDTPQQNVRLQACWNGILQANSSFGNNCFFTVPENTTDSWFRIILRGSTNMTGTSFRIMLCPRILWDISHQFEPYALSNPVLTQEVNWNVNQGVKNLFPYGDLIEITTNFNDKPFSLQAGDYKLSFQISATTGSYAIRAKDASNNSIFYETGSNSATTKTYDMTLSANAATITFYSSVSNNFTNIMLRHASITDSTFQPYALPNPTLTPALVELVDAGAKNLIYPNSASGTAIDVFNIQKHIKSGSYHLYFTAENYSGKYQLNFYDIDDRYISGGLNGDIASIKSVDFALIKDAYRVKFTIAGMADIANLMLCTAADWAISQAYQPYRPSWQEMYDMIIALQSGTRSAPALAKAEPEEIKEPETGEEGEQR